jgi:Domain of unknown function (DUF4251)
MRQAILLSMTLILISSCAGMKETKSARVELRNEKKVAKQALVKGAIESGRYIIKLNRVYSSHGGFMDLRPRANYIIVDNKNAVISAAYIGRQFNFRPIAGISMHGQALNYELTKDVSKGNYDIKLEVNNGKNPFYVRLNVAKDGLCRASLTNNRIDILRYSGYIVPILNKKAIPAKGSNSI